MICFRFFEIAEGLEITKMNDEIAKEIKEELKAIRGTLEELIDALRAK